jgi:hypothetical protein
MHAQGHRRLRARQPTPVRRRYPWPRLPYPQSEYLSLLHAMGSCRLRPPFSRHLRGLTSFDHVDDRSFNSMRASNARKTTCRCTAPLICIIAQRHPESFSLPVAYNALLQAWYDLLRGCPAPTVLDASEARLCARARMHHSKLCLTMVVQ